MPWCLWAGSSTDTPGEALPDSTRKKNWKGSSFPEGIGLSPMEWLDLAWSMAIGRQEECVPKQFLPDQRQQGHAG